MRDHAEPMEDDQRAADREVAAERALVARLRTGDDAAVAEVYVRFEQLLLEEARRQRVQPALRQEVVDDVITGVALAQRAGRVRAPRALGAFLMVALRRHVLNLRRADRRQEAHRAAVDVETIAVHDAHATSDSPAMKEIWRAALSRLDASDRELIELLADHVPQRLIAEWTGRTHDAVRSSAKRLRVRMRAIVLELAAALPPEDRGQVERRLARLAGGPPKGGQHQGRRPASTGRDP